MMRRFTYDHKKAFKSQLFIEEDGFMTDGKKSPWRAMALVSIISSYVVGGTVIGVFLGLWLGNQFGAKPFFLILFLMLGLGTGFYGVFNVIKPFLGDDKEK
jgi:F0F1-type ATP synthase assembly protein I